MTKKRLVPWMYALGRDPEIEDLSVRNRICSTHFTDDSFIIRNNKLRLKPNAIPTLNLDFPSRAEYVYIFKNCLTNGYYILHSHDL